MICTATKPSHGWLRGVVRLMVAVVILPLAFVLVGGGTASAEPYSRLREHWVDAPGGGVGQIKVRMWLANNGSNKALYLLDGLRATNDVSGWEHETNAAWLSDHGITVVEPVGGQSSFYTDWYAPSNTNGQPYTYKWESFLTQNLPDFLANNYGISRTSNAIAGLSMGGNAALILAAYHRDQFTFAGSMSGGYLNLSAPGMREAIRLAMLDSGGYNSDCMWGGPPWDPAWLRNDPFVAAPLLRGFRCGSRQVPASPDRTISLNPPSTCSTSAPAWASRRSRWPRTVPSRCGSTPSASARTTTFRRREPTAGGATGRTSCGPCCR